MTKLRVGVLFGGRSVEHEVSLESARSVMRALDPAKYDVIPIAITKNGKWLPPAAAVALLGPGPSASTAAESSAGESRSVVPREVVDLVTSDRPLGPFPSLDVVFPVVHGTFGEDGTLQGLLELADIPFVGAGVLASSVGMDKEVMKRLFQQAGLPVVRQWALTRKQWQRERPQLVEAISRDLGFPCFVKPANGGSSVGISKVHGREELEPAIDVAARLDRKVLVEEEIQGRELECSVLGNDEPLASAVGEIVPAREFYDYEAKYHDAATQLIVPAALPEETAGRVRELAVRAFQAIDCAGMARVDFLLRSSDGSLFVNEINTIPGFTSMSMYPRMWEASGLSYSELLDRLIELALERHQEARETVYNYLSVQVSKGEQAQR